MKMPPWMETMSKLPQNLVAVHLLVHLWLTELGEAARVGLAGASHTMA